MMTEQSNRIFYLLSFIFFIFFIFFLFLGGRDLGVGIG